MSENTLYRCEHPFREKKEITICSLSFGRKKTKEERKKEGKRNKYVITLLGIADIHLTKPKSGASHDSPIFMWKVAREWWHKTSNSKHEKHYQV